MANSPKSRRTNKAAESVETAFAQGAEAFPSFEVPEIVRSFAEQSITQTRDAYLRVKNAAEEASELLETSLEATRGNAREVQLKSLDIAKEHADASFELARGLLAANSVADAWQLQTDFARERFEAFLGFSKDVQESLTKAGTEAGKPAKAFVERTLSVVNAA